MYKKYFKRTLDILAAFSGLILLWPVLVTLTLVLAFAHRGRPFFLQARPGREGRIFRIIKFRTMNDKKDAMGRLLPDAERLTVIGRFVRKTSLDELPQLFNVLAGDMSLVGPRPLLPEYLDLYNDFQKRRHEVRPGITGCAQVQGRNALPWPRKFELDVWYVDHIGWKLDRSILFSTLKSVLNREGISGEGHATTEPFKGNELCTYLEPAGTQK